MKINLHASILPGELILILVIILLASCSNVSRKAISYIEINSNVSAICKFTDAWGTRLINTPGTVYADPRHGPAKLQCKSNGYKDFVAKEIGGLKNRGLYPAMISVTMLKSRELESKELDNNGNLQGLLNINSEKRKAVPSIEHVNATIKPAHNYSVETANAQENITNNILEMNSSHYTLSLFSMKSKRNALESIHKYGIKDHAMMFSYNKMGHQWHVVAYGDYSSARMAKDALTALPANLQKLKPWIRNFGSIHNDIRVSIHE